MPYFLYILQNQEDHLYTGQTSDVEARLKRHNANMVTSTKNLGPWEVVYIEAYTTRSEAMIQEKRLKKLKSKIAIRRYIRERTRLVCTGKEQML